MSINENETVSRFDEPTPNGGVYSECHWLNDDNQPTTKACATKLKLVEYSTKDEVLFNTYLILDENTKSQYLH